jgi:hypothetical protein
MRRKRSEGASGPATLGSTAMAHLLLLVWCKEFGTGHDLDPVESAQRYGADLPVPIGPRGWSVGDAAAAGLILSSRRGGMVG